MSENAMPTAEEAAAECARYTVQTERIPTKPGCWDVLRVSILRDGEKIGEYSRNYSALYDTFLPFIGPDGQTYALYSKDYTATRVMRLPSCEDICGEANSSFGFCPTGYYVPYFPEQGIVGQFGFLCGCVWGDDSSWKIQHLDLSKLCEGSMVRDARYGYVELLGSAKTLKDAIDLELWDAENPYVRISAMSEHYTDGRPTHAELRQKKEAAHYAAAVAVADVAALIRAEHSDGKEFITGSRAAEFLQALQAYKDAAEALKKRT